MTRVKICGITNCEDALAAASLGADALGLVMAPSPRKVSVERARKIVKALPPFVTTVGVFVNAEVHEMLDIKKWCGLDIIQLHGDEDEQTVRAVAPRVIKALRVSPETPPDPASFREALLLLDTYHPLLSGGAGETFAWELAAPVIKQRPMVLAGGLNPENVTKALNTLTPCAVDVSSGVESAPGKKDRIKMARFLSAVREFRKTAPIGQSV